jgi:hypothetical protein
MAKLNSSKLCLKELYSSPYVLSTNIFAINKFPVITGLFLDLIVRENIKAPSVAIGLGKVGACSKLLKLL